MSFIWNNKSHRINKSALQRPKKLAGLALPNFIYYYWACNIKKMLHWIEGDLPGKPVAWVQLEQGSSPYNLSSLICTSSSPPPYQFCSNPVIYHSLRIWSQFRRHFKLHTTSVHSPIKNNHHFPPSLSDSTFGVWASKGIKSISDLYVNSTFGSFTQLSQLFDLPKSHFFRYLQIRHFVQKNIASFPNLPTDDTVDCILSLSPYHKGLISTLYDNISKILPHSLQDVKTRWEDDLGEELTELQWNAVLDLIHKSSPCARHSLIQLKIVLRVHLTGARLAKIFPNIDPSCPRCKGQPADYMHMFWSCPNLGTFWVNIFDAYSRIFQTDIAPNPICALFGFTPETNLIKGKAYVIIAFTSLIARRLILLSWKDQAPPNFARWIRDTMQFLKLEKIRYTLKGSLQNFRKIWTPFLEYYDSLQVPLNQEN